MKKIVYFGSREYTSKPFVDFLNKNGVPTQFVKLPQNKKNVINWFKFIPIYVKAIRYLNAPLIITDSFLIPTLIFAFFDKFIKVKYIIRIRGDPYSEIKQSKLLPNFVLSLFLSFVIKNAQCLIAIDHYIADKIKRRFSGVKTYVVYNGIDRKILPSDNEIKKKEKELIEGVGKKLTSAIKIVTVISLNDERKLKGLLKARRPIEKILKKYNCVYLIVAYGAFLNQAKKKYRDLEKVYFFENQSRNEVMSILCLSDIFYYPTLFDLHPNTLLEAGIAELPVVTKATGGIPEMIQDRKTGLLVDNISHQSYDYLEILIKDPKKRKQLGKENKKLILRKFNWDNLFKKYIRLLDKYLINNVFSKTP
ncbi:MAG TPA: glycosyltransferase family 4 protein [Patescibacteria group bacterium]|nr:glycosyltransferase family 4 protein [Patescibacteria group bacterium]